MDKKILFRAVLEVLGKPQEHVEKSIRDFVQQLKENKRYLVQHEEFAEVKKQQEQELWAAFAELEVWTGKVEDLIAFCFDFMPSLIEIIEPKELRLSDQEVGQFLNDLQAKLHHVDMLTKHLKLENDFLKQNMTALLGNYVQVLLARVNLTSQQLSTMTGVGLDRLEDFLDQLIDQGRIDLKEGVYFLKKKEQ